MDEQGKPLYGDVFGIQQQEAPVMEEDEQIESQPWGELESESEEESESEVQYITFLCLKIQLRQKKKAAMLLKRGENRPAGRNLSFKMAGTTLERKKKG